MARLDKTLEMPSFLSKVFGRRKHEDNDGTPRASDVSLLEGKFEAVSPTVSPTAINFPESLVGKDKEKERDGFFGLSRSKSKPRINVSNPPSQGPVDDLPHLTLNLPAPKEASNARALGVVFEADPDSRVVLADADIGERRLNPLETLILVKACSDIITARGLETLGIMHPHWYSASPNIQRKLISLFIQSLTPNSPTTTLSPSSSSAVSAFESELNFTRSPHDVAAVLRWGLRHLKLDGTSFGKELPEWSWYTTFSEAERQASYPPQAYSENLVPQLTPAHLQLLSATLEILSSLAAHSEANSISGSKLSKFLGFWLLTAQRTDLKDDWPTFYARWERAGRTLEHLFLARIRDEAATRRMPTRLLELVHHYPYRKGAAASSDEFLSRPQFSTRQYDALFIRIETEVFGSSKADQTKLHPLHLIVEALKAETPSSQDGSENVSAWDKIQKAAVAEAAPDTLDGHNKPSRIFADETIRFLSLIPADSSLDKGPPTPKFTLLPQPPPQKLQIPSDSEDKPANGNAPPSPDTSANGHAKASGTTTTTLPSPSTSPTTEVVMTDWTQFVTGGFHESPVIPQILAGTLLDKDVEKTEPSTPRKPSKKRKAISPARSRRSHEGETGAAAASTPAAVSTTPAPAAEEVKSISRSTLVTVVQLDEAFIDFWSDALLDPISSTWPNFVICKLKNPVSGAEIAQKPIEWVVIEHAHKQPVSPVPAEQPEGSSSSAAQQVSRKPRPSSPKPSFRSDLSSSRLSSTLAATKKHFSFLTGVRHSISGDGGNLKSTRGRGKMGKSPKIGEMGEILPEEREEEEDKPAAKEPAPVVKEATEAAPKEKVLPGYDVGSVAAVAAAGVVAVAAAVESEEAKPEPVVQPAITPIPVPVAPAKQTRETKDKAGVAPAQPTELDQSPAAAVLVPEEELPDLSEVIPVAIDANPISVMEPAQETQIITPEPTPEAPKETTDTLTVPVIENIVEPPQDAQITAPEPEPETMEKTTDIPAELVLENAVEPPQNTQISISEPATEISKESKDIPTEPIVENVAVPEPEPGLSAEVSPGSAVEDTTVAQAEAVVDAQTKSEDTEPSGQEEVSGGKASARLVVENGDESIELEAARLKEVITDMQTKSEEVESVPISREHEDSPVVVVISGESPDQPELEAKSREESTTTEIQNGHEPEPEHVGEDVVVIGDESTHQLDLEAKSGQVPAMTEAIPAVGEVDVTPANGGIDDVVVKDNDVSEAVLDTKGPETSGDQPLQTREPTGAVEGSTTLPANQQAGVDAETTNGVVQSGDKEEIPTPL